MKKRVVALMLAMGMTFTFCACGASEDSSSETAQEDSASDTEDAVEESSVEDAEEESDAGEAVSESVDEETEENEEESEEVNEYGFTESQQEALVESVKNAITTDFLEPYNISPSEFVLQPYDVNDLFNYDSDGNYTGDDPYQTSFMWLGIDINIFRDTQLMTLVSVSIAAGSDPVEYIEKLIEDDTFSLNEYLYSASDWGISVDDTEVYSLYRALYKGIKEFINALETSERAELLVNLTILKEENSETVESGRDTYPTEFPTTSSFDKVITENIQFE